jgi:hypothetical protein
MMTQDTKIIFALEGGTDRNFFARLLLSESEFAKFKKDTNKTGIYELVLANKKTLCRFEILKTKIEHDYKMKDFNNKITEDASWAFFIIQDADLKKDGGGFEKTKSNLDKIAKFTIEELGRRLGYYIIAPNNTGKDAEGALEDLIINELAKNHMVLGKLHHHETLKQLFDNAIDTKDKRVKHLKAYLVSHCRFLVENIDNNGELNDIFASDLDCITDILQTESFKALKAEILQKINDF